MVMRFFIFIFILLLITFFAQKIWIDKVHHRKVHKILYKKNCIVNLSKFFLDIAKIVQDYERSCHLKEGDKIFKFFMIRFEFNFIIISVSFCFFNFKTTKIFLWNSMNFINSKKYLLHLRLLVSCRKQYLFNIDFDRKTYWVIVVELFSWIIWIDTGRCSSYTVMKV